MVAFAFACTSCRAIMPIERRAPPSELVKKLHTKKQNMDTNEPQELSDSRKSYAGIPEAQFVVIILY
jgi:hypothetical protein